MSEAGDWSVGSLETYLSVNTKEKEALRKQISDQTVLIEELTNLKKNRKVYTQQPNSNIFFLADRAVTTSDCKKSLDDMKKKYEALEKSEQSNNK